jgi:hypothetical protein
VVIGGVDSNVSAESANLKKLRGIIESLEETLAGGVLSLQIWKSLKEAPLGGINQALWFFVGVLFATEESVIMHLARLIDQRRGSENVYRLLDVTEQWIGNGTVTPDEPKAVKQSILDHRSRLKSREKELDIILKWRDKTIAHIDQAYVIEPEKIFRDFSLQVAEIERLFQLLGEILDYYSNSFGASDLHRNQMRSDVKKATELLITLTQTPHK